MVKLLPGAVAIFFILLTPPLLAAAPCKDTPKNLEAEVHLPTEVPHLLSHASGHDPDIVFHPLGPAKDFAAGCFPGQGQIQLRQFEFKSVQDPDLKAPVHLRAYVFSTTAVADSKKPRPVVAMFHGGAWRGGNPASWFPQGLYLASRGMVAISFQYRLEEVHGHPSGSHPSFPERAVNDARSAMYWLKENARALGIDPSRLVVAGDSAGGNLALETALAESVPGEAESKRGVPLLPKAIVPLYPVVDAENLEDGGGPRLNFPNVSPIRQLVSGVRIPEMRIILGKADDHPWTTPKRAEDFCKKANGLKSPTVAWNEHEPLQNSPCQLDEIPEPEGAPPGAKPLYPHAFMTHALQYRRMMSSMDEYLTKLGLLEGDASQAKERVAQAAPVCISSDEQIEKWGREMGYATGKGLW